MINHLISFLIGVSCSLTACALIKIFTHCRKQFLDLGLSKFWHFNNRRAVIVHPMYLDPNGKQMPHNMARIEDVLSMSLITSFFKEKKMDYRIQDDNKELPEDTDVILVCSPKGNSKSEEFSKIHSLPFKFCMEEDSNMNINPYFLDVETDRKYESQIDIANKNYDIALVGRLTDKITKKKFFLIWGTHGPGTLAATKYLTTRGALLKNTMDKIKDKDFAMLIEAPYKNVSEVGEAKLLASPRVLNEKI